MNKQALIVDDSASMRSVVSFSLVSLGIDVDEASGGRSGLEKARSIPSYAKTPIIVLTTESSAEMKLAFKQAGANGWMGKPFTAERMSAAIAKLL